MRSIVDLRSDTVTRPTPGMLRAMMNAEVGDDVLGDDPSVRRLEETAAETFGLEAGLFFPSGTQSNLAALMSHCQRGDEVILGQEAHSYRYEAGGAAVLGSIQPQTLVNRPDGTLDLAEVEAAVKPDDAHFARTRLLALENTISGRVLPPAYLRDAVQLAHRKGLALHLDGARIFNAAADLGVDVRELTAGFDTVSVCLSKGLGAPAGTVLVGGDALIRAARRARKLLGGAMRQAGYLAAAGLYALEHHVERLAVDHDHAARLARGLRELGLHAQQHTNMVFVEIDPAHAQALAAHLQEHGVRVLPGARLRLVTHLDVDAAAIDRAVAAFAGFSARARPSRAR